MSLIECRSCGATGEPIPIVYGYPDPESFAAAERGEIVLAGCLMTGNDPEWACGACRKPVAIRVAIHPEGEGTPRSR